MKFPALHSVWGYLNSMCQRGIFRGSLSGRKKLLVLSCLATHQPTAWQFVGSTALHHLLDASTEVGTKGPHGGKKLSKAWSRKEDLVGKKILFLLTILPSPFPDSWTVSLLCNLPFGWFYWWWTPCRPFRCQYWNKASMSQNGSTLNHSTLAAPQRWEHRLRKPLTQVRRRQAVREAFHLEYSIWSRRSLSLLSIFYTQFPHLWNRSAPLVLVTILSWGW